MALKFRTLKCNSDNYGAKRSLKDIKWIVIHYTGNKEDTSEANCKYFQSPNRHASAHVFVDGGDYVYKSVPLSNVAWSVGKLYEKKYAVDWGKCTNANSLNIEMCNSVGKVPNDVYKQTVELTKYYMKKYGVPVSHITTHFRTCGKVCPEPWASPNSKGFAKFKADISGSTVTKPKTTSSPFKSYKVEITASALNVRKSASASAAKVKSYAKGKVVAIKAVKNGWGQTKDGWICLKYTKTC